MLIMDGVKYEEWVPQGPHAEDEFEQVVKKHTQDIFGEQSIYLDRKQKLKSLSGIGSIPDGYVILLGDVPQWHIVEVELSSHPLHEHIVSQVSRFITGISNPSMQRQIAEAIYQEITRDGFLKLKVEQAIQSTEIYKSLLDLISRPPTLTIIIEEDTLGLREAISTLAHPEIKVVEFRTFTREGVGLAVHAHLFEPLYEPVIPPPLQPPTTLADSVEIALQPSCIKYYYIHIPKAKQHLFPPSKTTLELDTDIGIIEVGFSVDPAWGATLQKGLSNWFKAHAELKPGDKAIIKVIEPEKKYRLEIVKQEKEGGWRPIRLSP